MQNSIKLAMPGVNLTTQREGCRIEVRKHNKEVDKKRHILLKAIDCVQICGPFELALHGLDETESSDKPSILRVFAHLVAPLYSVLEEHLKMATVFTELSELLHCVLSVLKDYILREVKSADFIVI